MSDKTGCWITHCETERKLSNEMRNKCQIRQGNGLDRFYCIVQVYPVYSLLLMDLDHIDCSFCLPWIPVPSQSRCSDDMHPSPVRVPRNSCWICFSQSLQK